MTIKILTIKILMDRNNKSARVPVSINVNVNISSSIRYINKVNRNRITIQEATIALYIIQKNV